MIGTALGLVAFFGLLVAWCAFYDWKKLQKARATRAQWQPKEEVTEGRTFVDLSKLTRPQLRCYWEDKRREQARSYHEAGI